MSLHLSRLKHERCFKGIQELGCNMHFMYLSHPQEVQHCAQQVLEPHATLTPLYHTCRKRQMLSIPYFPSPMLPMRAKGRLSLLKSSLVHSPKLQGKLQPVF